MSIVLSLIGVSIVIAAAVIVYRKVKSAAKTVETDVAADVSAVKTDEQAVANTLHSVANTVSSKI